jgi:hypothetical protein
MMTMNGRQNKVSLQIEEPILIKFQSNSKVTLDVSYLQIQQQVGRLFHTPISGLKMCTRRRHQ